MKSWDKKNGETRGFICSQSNIILLAHLNIYYFAFKYILLCILIYITLHFNIYYFGTAYNVSKK